MTSHEETLHTWIEHYRQLGPHKKNRTMTNVIQALNTATEHLEKAKDTIQGLHRTTKLPAVTTTEIQLIQWEIDRLTARLYYLINGE